MKNYFNAEERTSHIVLLCCQGTAEKLLNTNALSDFEKEELEKAVRALKNLNTSIYARFGEPYKRKVIGTMQSNKLRLVGNYESSKKAINECATEDLQPKIKEMQLLNCMDCERCDYLNCAMYGIAIACDLQGLGNEKKCPFSI